MKRKVAFLTLYRKWCIFSIGKTTFAKPPYRRGQKILFSSKAVLDCAFLIYHAKLEKQSRINKFGSSIPKVSNWHFEMALKAQKRLFVPSFSGIRTGVALRPTFATWCVVKGVVRKFTLLALLGGNREADLRGMKSLEFHHLRLADMARPFCHRAQRWGGSGSSIPSIL